jgi:cell division protein FtsQ
MTALIVATAGRLAPLPRRAGRLAARVPPVAWIVAVLAVGALGGGWLWFRDSSFVAVRQVRVVGIRGPEARAVRAALRDAAVGESTLHVSVGKLRTAVSPYPLVHDLRVQSHFPHALTIVVLPERPVARLSADGHSVAVSAGGKVLTGALHDLRLPMVPVAAVPVGGQATGRRTLAAVRALAAAPAPLRSRVRRARWTSAHGLVIVLRAGPELYFGDAGRMRDKWLAAARVLADPTSRGADYVDVRIPERPAAGGVGPAGQGQAALAPGASPPVPAAGTSTAPSVAPAPPAPTVAVPGASTSAPAAP